MADCDHHVFLSDEILYIQISRILENLRSALIPMSLLNLFHFLLDDLKDQCGVLKNPFETGNVFY